MNFQFLTLFPEVFDAVLSSSLLGKAHQNGVVTFGVTQIRDFSTDKHRTVDDTPYGGGEGMLLKVDVLYAAWKSVQEKLPKKLPEKLPEKLNDKLPGGQTRTILMSPQGALLTQQKAKELTQYENLVVVCGHYEGVDERFIELCVDEELSIGDYILNGWGATRYGLGRYGDSASSWHRRKRGLCRQ